MPQQRQRLFYYGWMIYASLASINHHGLLAFSPHVDQEASDLRPPFRAFSRRSYVGAPIGVL